MKYDTESLHEETWKELEACIDAGLARNIGLSNFTKSQIENILSFARIPPAVLQVEVHPFFQQEKLVSFAHSRGIRVTGYSPLGSGSQVDGHTVPTHPALKKIGEKYGKSAAQVALRLQIQRGIVMIPKSVKEKRIQDNIALDFELSDKDMAELKTLDQNIRTGWGGPVVERDGAMRPRDELHPYYPFKMLPNGENDADIY
jgi:diketogulonate reductase-like aldo/keto reductase